MSLFLVVTLYSLLASQDEITERSKVHNRVAVLHEAGLAGRLPIAYVDRIRKVPGVKVAAPMSWFGGNYRERDDAVRAVRRRTPTRFSTCTRSTSCRPINWRRGRADKTGCVVGAILARTRAGRSATRFR